MREIAFDTETTGLDPNTGHRIVEIGCVEMMDKIRTGNVFQAYINPERDMPFEAERVHGITAKFLADKPVFAEIVDAFLTFVGDSPLVIHNAGFDMKFLNFELTRLGFPAFPMDRALDTVVMARKKFPGSPASLDALCKRFNIDLSSRTKHGALLDAELLADVYLELCGGRQAGMQLATASSIALNQGAILKKEAIPLRDFPIAAEEANAHAAFIQTLKNALWLKEPA